MEQRRREIDDEPFTFPDYLNSPENTITAGNSQSRPSISYRPRADSAYDTGLVANLPKEPDVEAPPAGRDSEDTSADRMRATPRLMEEGPAAHGSEREAADAEGRERTGATAEEKVCLEHATQEGAAAPDAKQDVSWRREDEIV